MAHFRGWRYTAFISGFVGMIGLTLYPIAFSPMMDSSEYKKVQSRVKIRMDSNYSKICNGDLMSNDIFEKYSKRGQTEYKHRRSSARKYESLE